MSPQATLQDTYDSLGSPFIRPNPMHQAGSSVATGSPLAASSSRPDRPPNNRRQETDRDEDKSATLENKRLKLHREKMIQKEKELKEKESKEKEMI